MHFFSTFLHYVFPVLCKCNLFSTTSCIFSTMSNIFLTTSNIYTTMSKTDYTCIQPKKDKHANDGSSVQKEEKIKDFTKNGKGGNAAKEQQQNQGQHGKAIFGFHEIGRASCRERV